MMRKYTVRRTARPHAEREKLLRRCYVIEGSDGVMVEVSDRIVMRFDSLHAFLVAFELRFGDLREIAS